jgi:hypothetical protein
MPTQLTTEVSPAEPEASPLDALVETIEVLNINPALQHAAPPGTVRIYCIPHFFRKLCGANTKFHVVRIGRKPGVYNNW